MACDGGLISGAVIGTVLTAVVGGVPLEHYRRHRDRQSTAAIIAAEIRSFVDMAAAHGTVSNFEKLLPILDANKDVPLPAFYTVPPEFGPIFERHIDKLGLLPPHVAGRVVRFYHHLLSIRSMIKNLVDTDWGNKPETPKIKAAMIRAGVRVWTTASDLATPLVRELEHIAAEPWCLGRGWNWVQSKWRYKRAHTIPS
jgi:hypothetical protein